MAMILNAQIIGKMSEVDTATLILTFGAFVGIVMMSLHVASVGGMIPLDVGLDDIVGVGIINIVMLKFIFSTKLIGGEK